MLPLVVAAEQYRYRQIRENSLLRGDAQMYKRHLQTLVDKYKLPAEEFIASDLPRETPLPRATTKGDTFVHLCIAGHSLIKSEPFERVDHPLVVAAEQYRYRQIRENSLLRGDAQMYKRHLQTLVDKYKLPAEEFIASDLPRETPLPRATTKGDTFIEDSGDVALISHTATGPNGGFSWSEIANAGGDADVVDAQDAVDHNGTTGYWRAEDDVDADDMYVEADIQDYGSGSRRRWNVWGRFFPTGATSAALDGYTFEGDHDTGEHELYEWTNGSPTSLGQDGTNPADGDNIRVEMNGTDITGVLNGSDLIGPITDVTSHPNTRAGFTGRITDRNGYLDNFEYADLAAAPAPTGDRRMIIISGRADLPDAA